MLKTCRVTYRDTDGVTHSVEVSASTLYEAAVLGIKAFEIAEWSECPRGLLEITVSAPAVKHEISVAKVFNWLQVSRSPRDVELKARLRQILGWHE